MDGGSLEGDVGLEVPKRLLVNGGCGYNGVVYNSGEGEQLTILTFVEINGIGLQIWADFKVWEHTHRNIKMRQKIGANLK